MALLHLGFRVQGLGFEFYDSVESRPLQPAPLQKVPIVLKRRYCRRKLRYPEKG